MGIIVDTSAWIEFFQSTEKGKRVAEVLKTEQSFTSDTYLAELVDWCLRNNLGDKVRLYVEGIKSASQRVALNEPIILASGKINYQRKKNMKKWGMMDSFILAIALFYDLKILTKDSDFRDLPNVEIL